MNNSNKSLGQLFDEQNLILKEQIDLLQSICTLQQREIEKLQLQLSKTRESLGMEMLASVIETLPQIAEPKDPIANTGTHDPIKLPVSNKQTYSNTSKTISLCVMPSQDSQGIVLMEVDDYNSNGAQMCLAYNEGEDIAIVTFNNDYEQSYLSYIEDFIVPFFEVQQICNGVPTGAETIKPGRAKRNGENWILTEKPTIKII